LETTLERRVIEDECDEDEDEDEWVQAHQVLPTGPTSGFADEKPVNF
jgi:hypothetical protein